VLKLKYVSQTKKRRTDGTESVHFYYRRPGQRPISLGVDPLTVVSRWKVLEAQFASAARIAVRTPGTLGELVQLFYASPDWGDLSDRTKELWRTSFRTLEDKFGDLPPGALALHVVQKWKKTLIAAHGPDGARNRLFAFRRLYSFAAANGVFVGENPFAKPGSFGKRQQTIRRAIWTEADLRKFLSTRRTVKKGGNPNFKNAAETEELAPPDGMRLGLLLGIFTMQRLSDVLAMTGRVLRKERGRYWLRLRQHKTGTEIDIPAHKILADEIERQKIEPGDTRFLVRSLTGLPFDRVTFYKRFSVWTEAAGLNLTFKDLRSSGMVMLAEMGVPTPQIVAISGHSIADTQAILDMYIVKTKKAALAAIEAMEGGLKTLDEVPQRSKRLGPAPRPARRTKIAPRA
jgi:integrase